MSYVPYLIAAAIFEALVFGWAAWVVYRESHKR